jgi:hypothetical protein
MATRNLALAVVLGGIALFLWGFVSHEVLPFYKNSLVQFTNEEAVTQAIIANAPAPGVYFMPYVPQEAKGMTAPEFEAAQQSAMDKLQSGPFVFAAIRLGPMGSFAQYILTQLSTDMLTVLFLALVVMKVPGQSYWGRVMTCVFIALAAFSAKSLPMWNWYEFSGAFTLSELIDIVGRMFCSGLVVARFIPGKSTVPA